MSKTMIRTVFSVVLIILLPCAAVGAQSTTLMRSQLDTTQAALYDVMSIAFAKGDGSFSYSLPTPVPCATPEAAQAASQALVLRAFEACYRDFPGYYWCGKDITYAPTVQPDGALISVGGSVSSVALPVPFEEAQDALGKAVNEILSGLSGSDAVRVRAIHKAIVERCQYDQSAAKNPAAHPLAYTVYGALVEGKATCEGYAKSFKLLCDRVGIPCLLVGGTADGENHMWNQVQVGNQWYLVDATFDDPVGGVPGTQYLLKGSAVSASHIAQAGFLEGFDPKFAMPALSTTDYVFGTEAELTSDGAAKEFCKVKVAPGTGGGSCVVKYAGNAGGVDSGQQVPGGIVLTVSVLSDPGYSLKEITVKMGGVELYERKKNSFQFAVTDDCVVSATFQKTT